VDPAIPVLAGSVSTCIFLASMLPMLVKAGRTKDLHSYSLGNIALSNIGNTVHSVYVFSLPMGPIWLLHSCYLVGAGLMLFWYLRHALRVDRDAEGRYDSRSGHPASDQELCSVAAR
jgi:uncharacterized protein with PQ loop repeat